MRARPSPAMPGSIVKWRQARLPGGAEPEGATMNAMDRRVFAESTVDALPRPTVLRGDARPDILRDEVLGEIFTASASLTCGGAPRQAGGCAGLSVAPSYSCSLRGGAGVKVGDVNKLSTLANWKPVRSWPGLLSSP